ncbi:MAG: aminotransferase class V-fold PLP-dependent enzyme [Phycisphaeraceae bacterium]
MPQSTSKAIANIRGLIPAVDDLAYFQTSGLALKLQPALHAAQHWTQFQARGPARPDVIQTIRREVDAVRDKVARALGAEPDEIALAENATVGINVVANGIDWQPGDHVILTHDEHPGNRIPWYNVAHRFGVELRYLDLDGHDDDALCRQLAQQLTDQTRLVAISHVSRRTGRRLPVQALIEIAHQRNIPIMLDGAQAFGAIPLDVHALDCDFYVFSGHKYIMAPQGTGGFYVRRDRIDWLKPSWIGSHSQASMDDHGHMTLHAAAKRFEFGTRNLADQIAFGVALDTWESVGWSSVHATIAHYTDQLKAALRTVPNLRLHTPLPYDQSSGIVTVEVPGQDATALAQHLLDDHHVLVSPVPGGEGRLRISTHIFNTEDEAQRLIAALHELAKDA